MVLLAPDVFPASGKVLRSPDMECDQLKSLSTLPEEDWWGKRGTAREGVERCGDLGISVVLCIFFSSLTESVLKEESCNSVRHVM